MDNTPSSDTIISNLKATVESLIAKFQYITLSTQAIDGADTFEKLEIELHAKAIELADFISGIKLQEALNSSNLDEAEKILVKSNPKKMKNMGRRTVKIRMLVSWCYPLEKDTEWCKPFTIRVMPDFILSKIPQNKYFVQIKLIAKGMTAEGRMN